MHVLLSGMTAQQANPASHSRAANYTGFLAEVLQEAGHDVDWSDPLVEHDLGRYDYVVVGVAPITSLGANRAYGALSIIERLWDSDKLTLLVDAPDPSKIDSSLEAITGSPENLVKPFFEYRKEYAQAVKPETRDRLLKAVSWLHTEDWPRTLVPKLPWHTISSVGSALPRGARNENTVLGDLEAFVVRHFENESPADLATPRWAYEDGSSKNWLKQQRVMWPMEKIPWSSRDEADVAAVKLVRGSAGTLISPQRDGTWWSSRYGMSLAQRVPVFTNWTEAVDIDPMWGTLPMVYETLDQDQREYIAQTQLESYMSRADSLDTVMDTFETIIFGRSDR